jgi:hypothetical protein
MEAERVPESAADGDHDGSHKVAQDPGTLYVLR